jgi:cholesterol transport system auxiliary component
MSNAIYLIAACARHTKAAATFSIILATLTGCALPQKALRPAIYDFGPGLLAAASSRPTVSRPPLAVADIEASPAQDDTAVLYRLLYTNDQQLRPYGLARWSMTPAQLIRHRLREHLGQNRVLLNAGETSVPDATPPLTLRIELEEFSQLFATVDNSTGLLRLRATLTRASPGGEKLVAQRSVITQRPAPTPDAPGGVRALTAATDAAVQEIDDWLQTVARQSGTNGLQNQ